MNFIVKNQDKRDKEIEKFALSTEYYPCLYPQLERTSIQNHLLNFIDEINVENSSNNINVKQYGNTTKDYNNRFTLKYVSLNNDKIDKYIILRELGHILLTSSNDNIEMYNGVFPYQGPSKLDRSIKDIYGKSLTNGTVNLLAKIAILNKENPNKIQNYIETGEYFILNDNNEVVEELARVLTIASTSAYDVEPSRYIANYIKNKGINYEKGSTYLNSCLNNDFSFEKEFDSYSKMGDCKKMYEEIDNIQKDISKDLPLDTESLMSVITKINSYYTNKLGQDLIQGKVNYNNFEILSRLFSNQIDKILTKFSLNKGDTK